MIKVCVFDMGRVVLDFDFERFYPKVLPYCPQGIGRQELEILVDQRDDELGLGLISFESYYRKFRDGLGVRMELKEFAAAWNDIFTEKTETTALLRRIQSVKLVMLSNTDESHIAWDKQHFPEAMSLFEQHFFSYALHVKKPSPEAFRAVEKGTSFAPEEHLLIDDLEINVLAARAAGWQGIVFTSTGALEKSLRELGVQTAESN